MNVNFWGGARLTQAVLPTMRGARRGRIVTLTSMNGLIAMPVSDAYNAAKFAVDRLVDGLAPVMAALSVHVSVIEPGPVRTAFFSNMAGKGGAPNKQDPYSAMIKRYNDVLVGMMNDGGAESPEGVAAVILEALMSDAPRLHYQSSPGRRAGQLKRALANGRSATCELSGLPWRAENAI